jgi:hypothetical protein
LDELKKRQQNKARADQDFLALLQMGNPDEDESDEIDEPPMVEEDALKDAIMNEEP